MGGYAEFCLENLFGWLKIFIGQIWSVFSNQKDNSLLSRIGENWKAILLVLCFAGAVIDLLVYLFRWEPIQVWKSYFRRRRKRKHPEWYPEDEGTEDSGYEYQDGESEEMFYHDEYLPPDNPELYIPQEETYSYPEPAGYHPVAAGPLYSAPNAPVPPEYQAMYRRPEPDLSPSFSQGCDPDSGSMTERNLAKVIGPRRKKFRVNELFRDSSDESSVHYDAPQPVIDRTEAYHAPVYPRNWNENGENRP